MKKILALALVVICILAVSIPAMAEEEVTFTWLHHFMEEPLQKWCEDRVAAFEAEYPNVTINIEIFNSDTYLDQLKMKIAAGDPPMIFDVDNNSYLKDFVAAGHIYCVDGMDYYNNIDQSLQAECQIDGVNYGSTISQCSQEVFYNKTMFDENGLTVPTTREEYIALCDKLLELGKTPISMAGAEMWCFVYEFNAYWFNYCLKDNPTCWTDFASGAKKFAEDEGFKTAYLEFMDTKKYWGDDPFGTSYDDACAAVANGDAGMIFNGCWVLSKLMEMNPDVEFDAFTVPTANGVCSVAFRPGSVQCVFNETEDETKLEYAKKFTASLFTPEAGTAFASGALQISSVNGVNYDFNDCIKGIVEGENKWSNAGYTKWSNEHDDVWKNTIMAYCLDDNLDAEALGAEIDEQFAAM